MGKLSKLQQKKIAEQERLTYIKDIMKNGKKAKQANILNAIMSQKMYYHDFENESGAEALCLLVQNNAQNKKHLNDILYTINVLEKAGFRNWTKDGRIVNCLAAIVKYKHAWLRPLEEYKVISHNPYRVMANLLRYLFAQYTVPIFLDNAFYSQIDLHIRWYIQIARGESVKKLDNLPLSLTAKMAHHFLHAPTELSVLQALRFGQIIGIGGSKRLAKYVMDSCLSYEFSNDDFWQTVIHFLVKNPMLDPRQIKNIIGFLRNIKFENQEIVSETGNVSLIPPADHNFSMKGRTAISLMRMVENWQIEQSKKAKIKPDSGNWKGIDVPNFSITLGTHLNAMKYEIKQIRTTYTLREEGRAMGHCVATYHHSCIQNKTSIWSLTQEDALGNNKRLVTIELTANKKIAQIRGKYNKMPSYQEYQIVLDWVSQNHLRVDSEVQNYVN